MPGHLNHDEQLVLAGKFLDTARLAIVAGRSDLVRHSLERAIGFASQVYGELQQEHLKTRVVLETTVGPVIITDEPEQERSLTEYGARE